MKLKRESYKIVLRKVLQGLALMEKYNVLNKYSVEFIKIYNYNETATKVFGNLDQL